MPRLPATVRRYAPVAAFVGGFVWDALTLGRTIEPSDLLILLGYLAAAAAILVAIGREVTFRGSQYLDTALQFLFGGIFSALFIFYFLSSSSLPGYLMFFNVALAHLFRSISTFWFYLGTLLAVLLVIALRRTSKRESSSIKPAIGLAAVMIALHVFNVIPPVPLVKKQMLIAHEVRRTADGYALTIESPGWRFWRASSDTFHRAAREPVYCFTSVFVPTGIGTTIRHRWELRTNDGWRTADLRSFSIAGGRQAGYRGYTYKSNVVPGVWRVTAESESGAAIGIVQFRVVNGAPDQTKKIRL